MLLAFVKLHVFLLSHPAQAAVTDWPRNMDVLFGSFGAGTFSSVEQKL